MKRLLRLGHAAGLAGAGRRPAAVVFVAIMLKRLISRLLR